MTPGQTPIPVILGPTGVGKSQVSFELAQRLNSAEIISADARAIFRGMDIGTAKPPREWFDVVPHHLINCCEVSETYSTSDFRDNALRLIAKILDRGSTPLIVGGTTLYLEALFRGFFEGPAADEQLRNEISSKPVYTLYQELREIDPESADRIHPHDEQRIVRALEVYRLTGETITALQNRSKQSPYNFQKFGLTCDRDIIHERIEKRVSEMMDEGLLDEAKKLFPDVEKGSQAYKSNGYKEIFGYLAGEWSLEMAIHKIKVNTNTHARRQFIFWRRYDDIHWIDTTDFELNKIVDEIYSLIN